MEVAKWMIAVVAVYNFGGLLFDAVLPQTSRMHLFNPAWPPHAKFHNGQTMLLGMVLGTLALVILFVVRPLTVPLLLIAGGVAGAYFVTMMFATLFPGTAWTDPAFRAVVPRPPGLDPQQLITYVLCAVWACAMAIAGLSSSL